MKCPKCNHVDNAEICPKCWAQGKSIPMQSENKEQPEHHSSLSPSSLFRRQSCPGSAMAEKNLPDTVSDDAIEGTMLHEQIAGLITRKAVGCEFLHGLSQEQIEVLDKCIKFINAQISMPEYLEIETEVKLSITDSNFEILTYGTCDVVAVSKDGRTAFLCDWKFGRGEVDEAMENIQLACYALGIAMKYGVEKVEAHIFQPRVYNGHTEYMFTDFPAILATLEQIRNACETYSDIRHAGDWCKYCKAKLQCPECMSSLARVENIKVELKVEHIHDISDPTVLCDLWKRAKLAEEIIESIRHRCKEFARLNQGRCGFLIEKPGRKTRKINNISKAFENLQGLLDAQDFIKACDASLPELEDLIAQKQNIKKAEAKRRLEAALGETLEFKEGEPTLAEEKTA